MVDLSRRSILRGMGLAGFGAVTASALAGCAPRSTVPITSGAANLQFWTHDPSYTATFETAIADAALVGDLPFEYALTAVQASGGDIVSRTITQAVANGNTPDLLGVVISEFPRLMNANIAENLMLDLSDVTAEFGDSLARTAPYSVDGSVYALESDLSISVQFYRADVFDDNGIASDIETWDEWLDAGAELNAKTGQYLGMVSNGDNTSIFNSFLQLFLQRGGSPFAENGDLTLDSEEALDALTFMQDGVASGALAPLTDPYGASCAAALKNSELVAIEMPNWYNVYGLQANAPEQSGLWQLRTLPRFSGGGHIASNSGGTGFGVVKDKSTTDAALELLQKVYLTREGQLLRYRTGGYLPTLVDLYEDPEFTGEQDEYLGGQRVFDVYAEAANDLPDFFQNAGAQILSTVAGAPILNVLDGSIGPEQALERIVTDYSEQSRD